MANCTLCAGKRGKPVFKKFSWGGAPSPRALPMTSRLPGESHALLLRLVRRRGVFPIEGEALKKRVGPLAEQLGSVLLFCPV